MLWLLIWRRALPTPSATSPALHGSSLQPLLVSVWSSTQRSSCSDPSYLIRPARSTPKNKAGGGAARKGSASAVFVLILPAKDLLPKVLHLFCQTAHSDSPCGHRVLGRRDHRFSGMVKNQIVLAYKEPLFSYYFRYG